MNFQGLVNGFEIVKTWGKQRSLFDALSLISEYCQNKPDIDAKCNQKKGQENLPNTWHGQPSNGRHRRQGKQWCDLDETISRAKKFSVSQIDHQRDDKTDRQEDQSW